MGTDDGVIREIKARLDLVEIVRRYVELRPVSGRWMGPCPFHQETRGSFSVNPELGLYHCFGCKASGDVIDFYRRMNGLEFRDALEALAAEAGVELKRGPVDPQADAARRKAQAQYAMHQLAMEYFRAQLSGPAGVTARAYVKKRGLSPGIVDGFGLGYAPESWDGLKNFLASKGHAPEAAAEAGLLARKEETGRVYDRFRGRLIFPIRDVGGRVIAFGGRILGDGDPKYLNSSDSPIYKKGLHLYGLDVARATMAKSRRAFMTEGYVDVLAMQQFGYGDAVGVLGTALTPEQVKRLAGFVSRVEMVFDGDPPGRKAALRAAEMVLAQGLACTVVLLPDGQDIDDLLRSGGRDAFEACRVKALDGLAYCAAELIFTASPREVTDWAVRFVSGLAEPKLRAFFLPRVAQALRLDEAVLGREITPGGRDRPGGSPRPVQPPPTRRRLGQNTAQERGEQVDRQLLHLAIVHPEYREQLAAQGMDDILRTDWARELWTKIRAAGGDDVFSRLNEAEKEFWAWACMQPRLKGDALADHWQGIEDYFRTNLRRLRQERCLDAIRRAQERGDEQELMRLCADLNAELPGSNDE